MGKVVGGAFWCTQHSRAECVHLAKASGTRCHSIAVAGTKSCRIHSGKRPAVHRAEGQVRRELAAFQLGGNGGGLVDEKVFLLELVGLARDRVLLVSRLLGELFREELERAADGGGRLSDDPVVGPAGTAAFVGHRFVLDKEGERVAVGEATRGLAAYEADWVDRAARLAKTAIDARLSDAQADVLALLSAQLQQVLDSVLTGLGIDPHDPDVVRVVAERLAVGAGPVAEEAGDG